MNNLNQIECKHQGDCLFFLDTNGQFAYVNEYFCTDMGYSREELIAQAFDELGMLSDSHNFKTVFKHCTPDQTSRYELSMRRKDGASFPAEINITHAPYGSRMLLRCDLHWQTQ